ncbi:MAG: hypothetical protein HZB91_04655 [Elusimicrobia bacterium]|nr:hypothetical protein [Elusimicrobiota bacterium]
MPSLRLELGGPVVEFRSRWIPELGTDSRMSAYLKFVTNKYPDAVVTISPGHAEAGAGDRVVYDTPVFWRVTACRGQEVLRISSQRNKPPCGVLIPEGKGIRNGRKVRRYRLLMQRQAPGASLIQTLDLISRQLTVTLLGSSGLLLHAAGLAVGEGGVALAGSSGAGKTTMTRLLRGSGPEIPVLSDDRIVLRRSGSRWLLCGTPWPGEDRLAANRAVPLKKLFILRQAKSNGLASLSPSGAAAALLRCTFAPWWDKKLMEAALGSCARLCREIPVQEFSFRNTKDAGAWLRTAWTA